MDEKREEKILYVRLTAKFKPILVSYNKNKYK